MTVRKLRVSPVKGLRQREVDALRLVPCGIEGDRRFAIVAAADRVLYAFYLPQLAGVEARWEEEAGRLELSFPDGETVAAVIELGDELTATASGGTRVVPGRLVGGPFAAALSERCGQPLRLLHIGAGSGGPGPITVIGDGTVRHLGEELGSIGLDSRRFRMSIEVAGLDAHEEDSWDGREVRFGDAVLRVAGQVPRCALMTQDPDTRERDLDVLRAILSYRSPMATGEPPLGMYATVVTPGVLRLGDAVEPL